MCRQEGIGLHDSALADNWLGQCFDAQWIGGEWIFDAHNQKLEENRDDSKY
jgi:hypothetical protein